MSASQLTPCGVVYGGKVHIAVNSGAALGGISSAGNLYLLLIAFPSSRFYLKPCLRMDRSTNANATPAAINNTQNTDAAYGNAFLF